MPPFLTLSDAPAYAEPGALVVVFAVVALGACRFVIIPGVIRARLAGTNSGWSWPR